MAVCASALVTLLFGLRILIRIYFPPGPSAFFATKELHSRMGITDQRRTTVLTVVWHFTMQIIIHRN